MVFQEENADNFIIIDGSSYLYRAFYALPNLKTSSGLNSGAIHGFANMLNRILNEYSPKYLVMVFDAKGKNFRHDIYDEYKANRNSMPAELSEQTGAIINLVEALGVMVIQEKGVEADDVIASIARQIKIKNSKTIISSGDKDLAQLVDENTILMNNFDSKVLDVEGVKEKFGVRPSQIFDYLCLVGDTSDNIPGVPKVGPKTAVTLLEQYNDLDNIIENSSQLKGKLKENIESSLETIELAKKLVALKDNLKLSLDPDQLKRGSADKTKLETIIKKYELKTLSEKLNIKAKKEVIKKDYNLIKNLKELKKIIKECKLSKIYSFDTETTSLDFHKAELVGFSLSYKNNSSFYCPLSHNSADDINLPFDDTLDILRELLEDKSLTVIGQNLKYDINVLKKYSVIFKNRIEDTMLMSYVISSSGKHDMDTLSSKFLDHKPISYESVAGKGKDQISFADVEISKAVEYACEDADLTFLLYQKLSTLLKKDKKLLKIYTEIEVKLMLIIADMEYIGVSLNNKELSKQSQNLAKRIDKIEKNIYKISGREFNISSPKQIQEIFYDELKLPILKKTPKGQPSTNEDVMSQLAEDHELPNLVLSYRNLLKLKNTYTDKLGDQVSDISNRLHTSYNQTITITGRLSSSSPNLQNIPIRTDDGKKIRSAFIPREGYKLFSADYSQIELRIMAHLAKDPAMIESFLTGEDIHSSTARKVFNIKDEPSSDQRRAAKAINFGLIYGISAYGLAKQLKIDNVEAKGIIDTYFAKYKRVKEFMEELKELASKQEYVETMHGRKVFLPNISHSNFQVRSAAERTAINAPIQGTAADIIKIAMINIKEWLIRENIHNVFMIMQVHDELVFEIEDSDIHRYGDKISDLMGSAEKLSVPLLVNTFSGSNWQET
ncbi:MAG: DNA polymerase I [Ectothiorhodospiraceae bacterium]|nr:MAG: DNA polymerase I [Ectothiorhodospiraceae bacterium]